MATGSYDANGIYQYGEDDNIALFSDLLNLGTESTSDAFTDDRARLATLEAGSLSGLIPVKPTVLTVAGGTGSINDLGTVTFTNCTSIALQGVFTTLYRNYKIVLNIAASAGGNVNYYLMSGAAANTANVYYNQELRALDTTVQGQFLGWPTTNGIAGVGVTNGAIVLDVYSPNIATGTSVMSDSNMGGSYYLRKYHNRHGQDVAFDGFNFQASTGNLTGKATVYGYND